MSHIHMKKIFVCEKFPLPPPPPPSKNNGPSQERMISIAHSLLSVNNVTQQCSYGEAPPRLSRFYTIFDKKGTLFVYHLKTNDNRFT